MKDKITKSIHGDTIFNEFSYHPNVENFLGFHHSRTKVLLRVYQPLN